MLSLRRRALSFIGGAGEPVHVVKDSYDKRMGVLASPAALCALVDSLVGCEICVNMIAR